MRRLPCASWWRFEAWSDRGGRAGQRRSFGEMSSGSSLSELDAFEERRSDDVGECCC